MLGMRDSAIREDREIRQAGAGGQMSGSRYLVHWMIAAMSALLRRSVRTTASSIVPARLG